MIRKLIASGIICIIFLSSVHAQTPIIKIDLNISGRTELEVNEPDTAEGINVNTLSVSTPGNVKVSNGMCFCSIKYCKCCIDQCTECAIDKAWLRKLIYSTGYIYVAY